MTDVLSRFRVSFFVSVPEPFRTASDSGCISSDGSGPYPVFPAIRPTVVLFDAMR